MKKGSTRITALLAGILLLGAALLGAAGCGITVKAENLMKDIAPGKAEEKRRTTLLYRAWRILPWDFFRKRLIGRKIPCSLLLAS